ncbi:hypothetical protein PLICRDRAFT_46081 [Plicaturopsis crispa FD-325 SS-3]|uniref:Aldolase n=1 Tax=Plicaturopsis crispa FD-325 SS-3 TaxID=944288 RepID=A0A0C9SRI0_PLICR|nr:hypothetical protein PLICRDRAFT_46081 [Plicaturopsis crispa FD-325 SS-3]
MSSTTLLSQIRSASGITVDVDSMDPRVAARHTTSSEAFSDMTSNQAILYGEALRPENAEIIRSVVETVKNKEPTVDADKAAMDVIDLLTVRFAKEVFPFLKGRVHAETSPSAAYDTGKTIEHATKLVALFEANGIPRERVCIKIPTTPESIVACAELEKQGIRTLATCLFSVPQAVAASQANCLYVAPYFNELRVHFEPTLWKEYKNTAEEHPMATVIHNIVQVFKKLGSKTLVMPASIVTAAEVIGLASLHPDHLTLAGGVVDQLSALPPVPPSSLETPASLSSTTYDATVLSTDYLAGGADALRKALAADAEATRKLADALKIFGEKEDLTKELIKKEFGL